MKIAAISGSLRAGSSNTAVLRAAAGSRVTALRSSFSKG